MIVLMPKNGSIGVSCDSLNRSSIARLSKLIINQNLYDTEKIVSFAGCLHSVMIPCMVLQAPVSNSTNSRPTWMRPWCTAARSMRRINSGTEVYVVGVWILDAFIFLLEILEL